MSTVGNAISDAADCFFDGIQNHVYEHDEEALLQCCADHRLVFVAAKDCLDNKRTIGLGDEIPHAAFAFLGGLDICFIDFKQRLGITNLLGDEVGIDDLDLRPTSIQEDLQGRAGLSKRRLARPVDACHQDEPRCCPAHARAVIRPLARLTCRTAERKAFVRLVAS